MGMFSLDGDVLLDDVLPLLNAVFTITLPGW
jgi:hypothetical protein